MSTWKLGTTLAANLSVTSIRLQRNSQKPDECTLKVATPFDSAPLFTHGATVILKKDDVPYFVGRCERDPRSASAAAEYHEVKLLGPWWYLENRIFKQTWTTTGSVATPTTFVILGMAADGSPMTTGQTITEALNFCIASGAPFQLGTIMSGQVVPMDQCNDITCAEVIHRCLRWTPDAVAWFDYTTAPYPSINIVRRADLTTSSLPAVASAGNAVTDVQCAPCHALKIDGVRLFFVVDSNPFPSTIQTAGTITGFQVLESTIRLAGAQSNMIFNKVTVAELTVDAIDASFWMGAHPWLHDVDSLTLHHGNLDNGYDLPNWLLEGTITDWMIANQGIHANACTAEVQANYTLGGTQYLNQKLQFKYIATDAVTKSYNWGDGGTPAESVPSGLAAAVLAACGTLHYEGQITLVDAECGRAGALIGTKLNLTGGLAAWASMNALITGTSEDISSGRTTVTFGPPPCLNVSDMRSLAQMNRIRTPAGTAGAKKAGGTDYSNSPSVGGTGGSNTPTGGMPLFKKLVVDDDDSHTVTIDPADTSPELTALLLNADGLSWDKAGLAKRGDVLIQKTAPASFLGAYNGTFTVVVGVATDIHSAIATITARDLTFTRGLLTAVGDTYTYTDCLPPAP